MSQLTHIHNHENLQLQFSTDFEPWQDIYENLKINLFKDNKFVTDITDLLDSLPGNPLGAILSSIDWGIVYNDYQLEKENF